MLPAANPASTASTATSGASVRRMMPGDDQRRVQGSLQALALALAGVHLERRRGRATLRLAFLPGI